MNREQTAVVCVLGTVFIVSVITWKQSTCFCSDVPRVFLKKKEKSSFKKLRVLIKVILMKKEVWNKITSKFIGDVLLQVKYCGQGYWDQQEQLPSSVLGKFSISCVLDIEKSCKWGVELVICTECKGETRAAG